MRGQVKAFCNLWNDLGLLGLTVVCAVIVVCLYSREANTLNIENDDLKRQLREALVALGRPRREGPDPTPPVEMGCRIRHGL